MRENMWLLSFWTWLTSLNMSRLKTQEYALFPQLCLPQTSVDVLPAGGCSHHVAQWSSWFYSFRSAEGYCHQHIPVSVSIFTRVHTDFIWVCCHPIKCTIAFVHYFLRSLQYTSVFANSVDPHLSYGFHDMAGIFQMTLPACSLWM
jgi:hypothetical protein